MAFVGVATGLVVWVEPASSGSGIPDLKAYLNGTNLRQLLTLKAAVCKVIGVLFSVGGGLCVGKEGPVRNRAALQNMIGARWLTQHAARVLAAVLADGSYRGSRCGELESWLAQLRRQALEIVSQRHRQAELRFRRLCGRRRCRVWSSHWWGAVLARRGVIVLVAGFDVEELLLRDHIDFHDQSVHFDLPRQLWCYQRPRIAIFWRVRR